MIGPLVAGLAAVAVGLTVSWQHAALAAVAVYGLRLLQDYVINPRMFGHAVGLAPLVVLVTVSAVGLALGPAAVPLRRPLRPSSRRSSTSLCAGATRLRRGTDDPPDGAAGDPTVLKRSGRYPSWVKSGYLGARGLFRSAVRICPPLVSTCWPSRMSRDRVGRCDFAVSRSQHIALMLVAVLPPGQHGRTVRRSS